MGERGARERERISARRRASAPPSQRRCRAALALLLAPPPRSAALDLGEKVGNGRRRQRARGPDAAGGAVAGQNPGANEVEGAAAGELEAGGTVVDGPEPNRAGSALVRRELGSDRKWERTRSSANSGPDDRRGRRCSLRPTNWGLTRSWPRPRRARGRRRVRRRTRAQSGRRCSRRAIMEPDEVRSGRGRLQARGRTRGRRCSPRATSG